MLHNVQKFQVKLLLGTRIVVFPTLITLLVSAAPARYCKKCNKIRFHSYAQIQVIAIYT